MDLELREHLILSLQTTALETTHAATLFPLTTSLPHILVLWRSWVVAPRGPMPLTYPFVSEGRLYFVHYLILVPSDSL